MELNESYITSCLQQIIMNRSRSEHCWKRHPHAAPENKIMWWFRNSYLCCSFTWKLQASSLALRTAEPVIWSHFIAGTVVVSYFTSRMDVVWHWLKGRSKTGLQLFPRSHQTLSKKCVFQQFPIISPITSSSRWLDEFPITASVIGVGTRVDVLQYSKSYRFWRS